MSITDKKKRRVTGNEGRAIIARVFHFLKDEYNYMKEYNVDNCDLSPLANVRRRTAEATGVSERTVTKILKEESESPDPFSKIPMKKQRQRKQSLKKTPVKKKISSTGECSINVKRTEPYINEAKNLPSTSGEYTILENEQLQRQNMSQKMAVKQEIESHVARTNNDVRRLTEIIKKEKEIQIITDKFAFPVNEQRQTESF